MRPHDVAPSGERRSIFGERRSIAVSTCGGATSLQEHREEIFLPLDFQAAGAPARRPLATTRCHRGSDCASQPGMFEHEDGVQSDA